MKMITINTGNSFQLERLVISSPRKILAKFPTLVFAMEHPKHGIILFDCGYSEHLVRAVRNFPYNLYQLFVPFSFEVEQAALFQLKKVGINQKDVKFVIISHLHADHIGGLKDFPFAKFLIMQEAWEANKNLRNFNALRKAFIPDLVPNDFTSRIQFINAGDKDDIRELNPHFSAGFRIFDDGSLVAVPLPGHAEGHIGLLVQRKLFLIADACWQSRNFQENVPPHPITNLLFSDNSKYRDTLNRLHLLSHSGNFSNVMDGFPKIVPSHCGDTFQTMPEVLDC